MTMPVKHPATIATTPLWAETLASGAAFRALEPAWMGLLGERAAPFHDPRWFAVWARALARAPQSLRLVVAHAGGELAAVLPLLGEHRRMAGVPVRVLRSLSDEHSQRYDLLACSDGAIAALWHHLAADRTWDMLELRDIPETSWAAARLEALAAASGFLVVRWPAQDSPYLRLPSCEAALERALEPKFRANLRRRRRKLGELGTLALEPIDGRAVSARALDAILNEGFALERSGWKGERGTAIACQPALLARYHALAHVFARRGELALHFLRLGERRVAFHFAIESGGVYFLFKPGYDAALHAYGLGHLLLWEVARRLILRGVHEIDFLGDDLPWKRAWTECRRLHSWRLIYRPTPLGRALHGWKRFKMALSPR